MIGFSLAYLRLDAGLGALILFGGVQVTMFAGSVLGGDRPALPRWLGSGIALAGLAYLFWPRGETSVDLVFAGAMATAALGWGIYSLNGRAASDPLSATAFNFALATPVAVIVMLAVVEPAMSTTGVVLAIVSGVITSGFGYALWYVVLPRLETSVAALSQLTVPIIAIVGGTIFLSEPITVAVLVGTALVIGGVGIGILSGRRKVRQQ